MLASVTLPILVQKFGATDDVLRVRLTHDAGGTPGATIEVLSLNQGIWPTFSNPFTNKTTLYSTANPVLSGGSNYWIVTEPTAIPAGGGFLIVDHRWFLTTNGPQVSFIQQQVFGGLPSDPWSGPSGSERLALRVEGTPTSTPNLSIRFSAVEVCWPSCSNAVYQVQYASELNTNLWMNLGLPVLGTGSRLCVSDSIPEGEGKRFYRLILP